tara:strand:- start:50 stop:361 length:312 start_codon:yes stop_codon:yes gene_type:complete
MKELHKVKFKINKEEDYRNWVKSNEHKKLITDCGAKLIKLKEVKSGVYLMEIIIDTSHPKADELMMITENNGFRFTLLGVPVVKCVDEDIDGIINEMKEVLHA